MTPPPDAVAPLLNLGAMGFMLAWFMLRQEPRQIKMEESLDRLSRTINLLLIAQDFVPTGVKREAREILGEIDDAEKDRKSRR